MLLVIRGRWWFCLQIVMRLGCGLLCPPFGIAWCGAACLPVLTRSGSTCRGTTLPGSWSGCISRLLLCISLVVRMWLTCWLIIAALSLLWSSGGWLALLQPMGWPFVCGAALELYWQCCFPCGWSDGFALLFLGCFWRASVNHFFYIPSPSLCPLHADLWGLPVGGLSWVLCGACMYVNPSVGCVCYC